MVRYNFVIDWRDDSYVEKLKILLCWLYKTKSSKKLILLIQLSLGPHWSACSLCKFQWPASSNGRVVYCEGVHPDDQLFSTLLTPNPVSVDMLIRLRLN